MDDSLKISIIVPVFQVERYLAQCVDSILQQTYQNFEVILVDDGSTDGSPEICDSYSKKSSCIKVLHQKNSGLSQARNSGIRVAAGDYIAFLDGDDFWDDSQALERLVARLNVTHADVLNFSYKKYFEDTDEKKPYFLNKPAMPTTCIQKDAQLDYLGQHGLYIASACNKLINRDIFSNNLWFRPGIFSEDIEWCVRLELYAHSMDFVCENFYCYRQRSSSITHTITPRKCLDLKDNILACVRLAQNAPLIEKDFLFCYAAYQYCTFFKVQAQAEQEPVKCIQELSDYAWILKYHNKNPKLGSLQLGCKVLGYPRLCRLIRFLGNRI